MIILIVIFIILLAVLCSPIAWRDPPSGKCIYCGKDLETPREKQIKTCDRCFTQHFTESKELDNHISRIENNEGNYV